MEGNILKLYPQYNQKTDRRQNNVSVDSERRSGMCRRESTRPSIDLKLIQDINRTKDIFAPFLNAPQVQQIQPENKSNTTFRKAVIAALSPIIPVRRISSLPDNIEDGNYVRAAGLVALAGIMLPEDTRDLKDAAKQIFKCELPKYDYKNCQARFSFFRGTVLQPVVNKMGKLGIKLYSFDKTLYDTKIGDYLCKIFNINIDDLYSENTCRKVPKVTLDESGKTIVKEVDVYASRINGKSLAKLIGRSLLRIPIISVLALSLLELPLLIKKIKNDDSPKNKFKEGSIQAVKSSINVSFITAGIGLIGALFAKKGPAYSLLGMGIGSVAGAYSSKFIQKGIENITDQK
ncbi:MAG: hypothetical protein PHC34_13675 [Candidatus Gastranaerophilales bacterium]|nr:hypothetical protein [Candidatus Gastranaerophilales bacterium]